MFIFVLSGRKQSGKNEMGRVLAEHFGESVAKEYAFADPLKNFCRDVLNIPHQQVYGTDADKNSLTKYKWDDIPKYIANNYKSEQTSPYLSARTVLCIVGTELLRNQFYPHIWAEATFHAIHRDQPEIAIVTDCRFPNEIEAAKKYKEEFGADVCIIRIKRPRKTGPIESQWQKIRNWFLSLLGIKPKSQDHTPEAALDGFDDYDFVINNDGTLTQYHSKIYELLADLKIQ